MKASVLSKTGTMMADRVRVETKYPLPPEGEGGLVGALTALVKPLPEADRVRVASRAWSAMGSCSAHRTSCARRVRVRRSRRSSSMPGPFRLGDRTLHRVGKPTKVANDADVQGAAVVQGKGLEVVITLGTGFGSAFFMEGQLMPHIEIAHQPFRKEETYNDQLGELARKTKGDESWNHRVREAVTNMEGLFFYDHLYIGGGNARRIDRDKLGDALERITIIDNSVGILGGIKLWEVS